MKEKQCEMCDEFFPPQHPGHTIEWWRGTSWVCSDECKLDFVEDVEVGQKLDRQAALEGDLYREP